MDTGVNGRHRFIVATGITVRVICHEASALLPNPFNFPTAARLFSNPMRIDTRVVSVQAAIRFDTYSQPRAI